MEALLTSETLPVKLPPTVHPKSTLNELLCPTASVRGSESPLLLNPDPVTVAVWIVRLADPVSCSITGSALVVPIVTYPKLRLVGVVDRNPATPVPDSEMTVGELVVLLTSETLPVTLPLAVGEKTMLKDALLPGQRLSGRERPVVLNPVPLTLDSATFTTLCPVFERVTVCVLLLPTGTSPKLMLVGAAESVRATQPKADIGHEVE